MRVLRTEEIGGGIVRRKFSMAGKELLAGHPLSQEEARSIPIANRNALISSGALDVWPVQAALDAGARGAAASEPTPVQGPEMSRYILPVDGGFDVLEGHKLNDAPLKKADAKALAVAGLAPTPEGSASTH